MAKRLSRGLVIVAAVVLTAGTARAYTPPPMEPVEIAAEAALVGLAAIDLMQTSAALYHGANACRGCPPASEANPLLGRHPSPLRLNVTVLLAVAAHAAITYALPRVPRGIWLLATVGIEAVVVSSNYVSIGAVVALPW